MALISFSFICLYKTDVPVSQSCVFLFINSCFILFEHTPVHKVVWIFLYFVFCTFSARGKWMGYWLCFEEERCETCTNWTRFWHRGIYKLQASQASI